MTAGPAGQHVKERRDAPAGFFEVEAAGLAWLAVPGGAAVVGVRSVRPGRIVLDRLVPARPTPSAAERFGRALAVTHDAGAAAYGQGPDGWRGDGFIGSQPMGLRPEPRWGTFYAGQRLLPYARRAVDAGTLSRAGLRDVERVAGRLAAGELDDDALGGGPARIHGDLWSGNVVFTADGVVLIDPAVHGGHRLTDLAMLELFGAPHLDRVTGAYAEAAGLDRGWRDLVGLHQLHPLLVHAVTHGPLYGEEAAAVAARYA